MSSAMQMDRDKFTAARQELGLSQSAMARALGVDRGTLIQWEKGNARIPYAVELAIETLRRRQEEAAG